MPHPCVQVLLVLSSAVPPDELFCVNGSHEEPILDLEQLQFEGAVEGGACLVCRTGVAHSASPHANYCVRTQLSRRLGPQMIECALHL